jgi:lipid-binding SYLF domain-containing protein
MTRTLTRPIAAATLMLWLASPAASAAVNAETKLTDAAHVLEQLSVDATQAIPPELLGSARAVAIIPNSIRGGFLVGGRRGRGVLAVRDERGAWTNPAFVILTGGSIGWQIGAESTDIVLVFANARAVEDIERGKFSLRGDLTAVAGPVGHHTTAAITWNAEVYAYVLGRGLFAGAAFEGAKIAIDEDANRRYYGASALPFAAQSSATPASARAFLQRLGHVDLPINPQNVAPPEQEAKIYPLAR